MAYNKFSIKTVGERLGLAINLRGHIFENIRAIKPRPIILELLEPMDGYPLVSEIARREWYIATVFRELLYLLDQKITIWSAERFDVDPALGLVGEADYLMTYGNPTIPMRPPVIAVAEAKPDNLRSGMGQCIAEMYAAKIYNERAGITDKIIYGIVTTGLVWGFLRLTGQSVEIDTKEYTLQELDYILGIIVYMTVIQPVNVYQPNPNE
jgi:hypothetical protein